MENKNNDGLRFYKLIIIINLNRLLIPIRQRLVEWMKKNLIICCLQETQFK